MNPFLSMLLATLFFSFMDLLVKSLGRIPTQQIVFFRAAVALLICIVIIRRKKIRFWGTHRNVLLLRGLFGTVALIIYFYTLKHMPLATAVTLHKFSPLFAVLFALLLRGQQIGGITWLYFSLAFLGAVILKLPQEGVTLGLFALGIVAAAASGLAYNCISHLKDKEDPMVIIFYFPMVTLPMITPVVARTWVPPSLSEWLLLILVGIVVQTAQFFMTLAFQNDESSKVSIVYYVGTVLAVIYGWWIFGERLGWVGLSGIALIVFAVVMQGRSSAR